MYRRATFRSLFSPSTASSGDRTQLSGLHTKRFYWLSRPISLSALMEYVQCFMGIIYSLPAHLALTSPVGVVGATEWVRDHHCGYRVYKVVRLGLVFKTGAETEAASESPSGQRC